MMYFFKYWCNNINCLNIWVESLSQRQPKSICPKCGRLSRGREVK